MEKRRTLKKLNHADKLCVNASKTEQRERPGCLSKCALISLLSNYTSNIQNCKLKVPVDLGEVVKMEKKVLLFYGKT